MAGAYRPCEFNRRAFTRPARHFEAAAGLLGPLPQAAQAACCGGRGNRIVLIESQTVVAYPDREYAALDSHRDLYVGCSGVPRDVVERLLDRAKNIGDQD